MENPIESYWKLRIKNLKKELESNQFNVYLAADEMDAKQKVVEKIVPEINPKSISWGGSQTFISTGLYQVLREMQGVELIDTFEKNLSPEASFERRRQALFVDLFITGTNAITEGGQLVNLDMIGNRIGGITFGPKHVVILAGRNKIVPTLEEAFFRVKNYTAPTNAMRLDKKTPCVKTSFCEECKSPDRICNTWTVTEKSFPKGRVNIVLIDKELGL